jgi:hypothetical protein
MSRSALKADGGVNGLYLYATTLLMSRWNGHERRGEDDKDERVCSGHAAVAARSRTASRLEGLVVGGPDGADSNTRGRAQPAGRRGAIGNGLLGARITSYAAVSAA